ncbi:MAG: ATP-binding cassette domain-containing protein [Clostridia bacterium]|nr:ATP-binding cassette domain-containing protein [Clostridia bacterium]
MVEINNLVKRYGAKFAVDDISFSVGDGEIVGFLGPNGAGKSTTMNVLTGYLSATSGSVLIDGIDISQNPTQAKKLIGYLPEQPPLYMDMTVLEYLNFVFDLKGCQENKKLHIEEICNVTKIADVKKRLIKNLSKGYKQRVGIASALVGNPKFIILDEPTVGLDPKQIIEIRNLIRNLGKKHTVILSTHILPEVQAICDRIVVINGGKIVADGKTADINGEINQCSRYRVKVSGPSKLVCALIRNLVGVTSCEVYGEREGDAFTYTVESTPNIDIRKNLFRALADKGWPMLGMEPVGMELEDVFMRLINSTNENIKAKGGRK